MTWLQRSLWSWGPFPRHLSTVGVAFPSRKCRLRGTYSLAKPLSLRHTEQPPTALPSSNFPCTPLSSTQDQAPVAQTHTRHTARNVSALERKIFCKQRKKERKTDLKKEKKRKEKTHAKGKKGEGIFFPYSQLWFHRGSWGVHLRRVKCSRTDGTGCSPAACSLPLLIARRLIAPSLLAVCYDHKRGSRSFVTCQIRNNSALSVSVFLPLFVCFY